MPNSINYSILTILFAFGLWGCSTSKGELPVVKSINLQRYSGKWYEILKLPNSFESGLTCITANYSIKENGDINVENSGHKIGAKATVKTSTGTAWEPNPDEPTKLKVRFFWPFSGNYWIIALDQDYKYVMIGEPSRDYLWILSRDRSLPQPTIDKLLAQAKSQGFDTSMVERTSQDCQ